MAKKKETTPEGPEKKGEKRSEPDKQSQDSPLAFLEQIATLFKLRLLKEKLGVDKVDQVKLNELQTKLSGGVDEKAEAETEIGKIYKQVIEVDQATFHKEVTLENSLQKAAIKDDELLGRARQMDARMQDLRSKGAKATTETEANNSIADLNEIADRLGLDIKVDKDEVDQIVGREIGRLHELRDIIQITQQRNEIREIGKGLEPVAKKLKKDEILDAEDFKEKPEEKNKIMRVKTGNNQYQREATDYVANLKRDFSGDTLERTDETNLAEGFLQSKKHNLRRLSYGEGFEGIRQADELTFKAGLVYSDRLIDQIVERVLRNVPKDKQRDSLKTQMRGAALNGVIESWTSKKADLSPDDVIGIIEQKLQQSPNEQSNTLNQRRLNNMEENDLMQMYGGRSGAWSRKVDFWKTKEIGLEEVSSFYTEKRRELDKKRVEMKGRGIDYQEEFGKEFDKKYGDKLNDEKLLRQLRRDAEELFGNEHQLILEERLRNGDYEGYLKHLMSYLYKVGLREGRQDFLLQGIMREARTKLASAGKNDLLSIYEAFEQTAMFHDVYYQLDREGYAKVLNSWGVEALQVFKNKEANTLNVKVIELKEDGKLGKKLPDLSIIKYDDMLQSTVWARRMTYGTPGEIFDEEKVYDDMLVTMLYGDENKICKIIEQDGRKMVVDVNFDINKPIEPIELIAYLDELVEVDGKKVSLETLIQDSRYMAGIAHDMWRLTGRNANILDDMKISGAVGANKELNTTWNIRRYAEEYGFVPTWMFEALSLDNFIYEVENYKDMPGAGMKKLFKNSETGDSKKVTTLVSNHIRRQRTLRGERFYTNFLSIEDVRLLSNRKGKWTLEDSTNEYIRRQKLLGNTSVNVDNPKYKKQIGILHNKWTNNMLSDEEREQIDAIDWKKVNKEYAKVLGVDNIGDNFEDFIKNFSFGRLSATEKLRGTDLKDYGGYFLKSGAVVDIFKSGFGGAATEAIAKIFGTMEGYQPYDSSGLRRFFKKEMEVMYSWDDKKWSVEVPPMEEKPDSDGRTVVDGNLDGERLPNDDLLVDENGYWTYSDKKMNENGKEESRPKEMLFGKSLLEKSRMRKPRNERDVEYAVYSMVGSGTMDRETAEEFLDSKYGGIFKKLKAFEVKIGSLNFGKTSFARGWRWIKRWTWLDDPWILFEAAWEDGKKATGGFFKYIFG